MKSFRKELRLAIERDILPSLLGCMSRDAQSATTTLIHNFSTNIEVSITGDAKVHFVKVEWSRPIKPPNYVA